MTRSNLRYGGIFVAIYDINHLKKECKRNYIIFISKQNSICSTSKTILAFAYIDMAGTIRIDSTLGFDYRTEIIVTPNISQYIEIKEKLIRSGYFFNKKQNKLIKV